MDEKVRLNLDGLDLAVRENNKVSYVKAVPYLKVMSGISIDFSKSESFTKLWFEIFNDSLKKPKIIDKTYG